MKDLSAFLETVNQHTLFDRAVPVTVARAPGRLDVMGGIADYSGSLVLQRPIAEATFAALQVIDDPAIHAVSLGREPFTIAFDSLLPGGEPISYDEARTLFRRVPDKHWASYVV